MTLANGFNVAPAAVERNLKRLTNQIYKLLPSREEGLDWQLPLDTIIEELINNMDMENVSNSKLIKIYKDLEIK